MKIKLLSLILLFQISNILAQDIWMVDPHHSSIQFAVDHLVISEVTGSFNPFKGNLTMENDDLTTATLKGEVEVSSVDTKNADRDKHLKAPDFFDVGKHPKILYESTAIKKAEADNSYVIEGNLTIKGVKQNVKFVTTYKGTVKFMGQTKAGIKAIGKINRKDYGLNYDSLLETGGAIIGNEVTMTLNFELIKR